MCWIRTASYYPPQKTSELIKRDQSLWREIYLWIRLRPLTYHSLHPITLHREDSNRSLSVEKSLTTWVGLEPPPVRWQSGVCVCVCVCVCVLYIWKSRLPFPSEFWKSAWPCFSTFLLQEKSIKTSHKLNWLLLSWTLPFFFLNGATFRRIFHMYYGLWLDSFWSKKDTKHISGRVVCWCWFLFVVVFCWN